MKDFSRKKREIRKAKKGKRTKQKNHNQKKIQKNNLS